MSINIKIPSVGESITEVTIAAWLKQSGEAVEQDEPICEVESDKATVELAAEQAGVLETLVPEGETVEIGAIVAKIEPGGAPQAAAPAKSAEQAPQAATEIPASSAPQVADKPFPSPAAKKILAEKGIDSSQVAGTGKDGRITKADAMNAEISAKAPASAPAPAKAPVKEAPAAPVGDRAIERKRMTPLRKTIARRLVDAKNTTAMLTTFNEVDMSAVMDLRKQYKEVFKKHHDVNLGFMSFFTKAVCMAIQKYPLVNAMIEDDQLVIPQYADIGIAVSAPKGLVVPVLRNAEKLSMAGIEKGILDLALRARDNKLSIDEMQGGTFTITNGGIFGSMLSTPIINIPQSAILGMHNIVERPVAINGEVKIRPIMYVALSYDHRVVDGRESVSFLKTIKEMLEEPARLLLEV